MQTWPAREKRKCKKKTNGKTCVGVSLLRTLGDQQRAAIVVDVRDSEQHRADQTRPLVHSRFKVRPNSLRFLFW